MFSCMKKSQQFYIYFPIRVTILTIVLIFAFFLFLNLPGYADEKERWKANTQSVKIDLHGEKEKETEKDTVEEKVFTVDDCLEIAFKIHPSLKSAFHLKEEARAGISSTASSYYPQVSFSSTYNSSVIRTTTDDGVLLPSPQKTFSDSYITTFSLSQRIYDFGKTRYKVIAARENLNSAFYDLLAKSDEIVFKIRQAFYEAVAAEKSLAVAREAVEQRQQHLKQAMGFYRIGRRSRIEVTKAEVDLASARLDLLEAENSLEKAKVNLANAIGMPGSFDHPLDGTVTVTDVKYDFEEIAKFARKYRPEMLKIRAQQKAQKANLDLARADYFPTLTGSAYYSYRGSEFTFRNNSWGWGVSLNFDIFTSGQRAAEVRSAWHKLESIKQNRERLWQNIYLETKEAYLDLLTARKKIDVAEKSLEKARENFELARGRYKVGVGTNLEFSDAQLNLQEAQNDLIQSILSYQIARARFEKATGMTTVGREFWTRNKNNKE